MASMASGMEGLLTRKYATPTSYWVIALILDACDSKTSTRFPFLVP